MSPIIRIEPLNGPWQTRDPFLFCVYHYDKYPASDGELGIKQSDRQGRAIGQDFDPSKSWRMYHGSRVPGFPYHPHRGFETITIGRKGYIDHSDSLGASGRFGNGDVQWMTAGKGVLHSEMFPLLKDSEQNPLELFQIWLNLPRSSKLVEPDFKMLWKENIPVIENEDANGKNTSIDLIAGKLNGSQALDPTPHSWAANSENEVLILTIKMDEDAHWQLPAASAGLNRSIFVFDGSIEVEGKQISAFHMFDAKSNAEIDITAGSDGAQMLVLQGKPINEPVAQHGPFVMNTQAEIMQAFQEYQQTQFGGWPWPQQEMTHGANKGRFAKYPDGKEEVPV